MGQRGFWDEQQRVAKLQEKKPVLTRLTESIPWESFRPLLDKGYSQERKSNAGRKRIDPLILFKMLVLQQLFNLSDEEVEFQVNDRRSFEEFVGLGVMNDIPDATTVAGRIYYIKSTAASTTVTIATTSSQTIDGSSTSRTITTRYKGLEVVSDGANWHILSEFDGTF